MASGFRPIKARAKEFNYKPRYYNPQKEERELRREELTGRRLDLDDSHNTPGDMIRRQVSARRGSRLERKGLSSVFYLVFGLAILLLIAANVAPLLDKWFGAGEAATPTQRESVEEFNPYTPITIVPNDYQE
ncbi:MAG: hypothetical protein SNJ33_01830 [Rikenellaceae bacterium]